MPDPMLVSVTRTVRLRIAEGVDPGVIPAIKSTQAEWCKAVGFYTGLFLEHPGVYDEKKTVTTRKGGEREVSWTAKDRLTWAERMSVRTEDHPLVLRDFGEVCPQMPVTRRRAAINAASGAVASYLTNHKQWEKADPEKRGKEPKLPDPHPHLTLYGGMYDLGEARLRQGSCRLKLSARPVCAARRARGQGRGQAAHGTGSQGGHDRPQRRLGRGCGLGGRALPGRRDRLVRQREREARA
jgi:hypothetical protein